MTNTAVVSSFTIHEDRWNQLFSYPYPNRSGSDAVFARELRNSPEYGRIANSAFYDLESFWVLLSVNLKDLFDRCALAFYSGTGVGDRTIADHMIRRPDEDSIGVIRERFFEVLCPKVTPLTTELLLQLYVRGTARDASTNTQNITQHNPTGVAPRLFRLTRAAAGGGSRIW